MAAVALNSMPLLRASASTTCAHKRNERPCITLRAWTDHERSVERSSAACAQIWKAAATECGMGGVWNGVTGRHWCTLAQPWRIE